MKSRNTTKSILQSWQSSHVILTFESLLTGILTGLVITLFRRLISSVSSLRNSFYEKINVDNLLLILPAVTAAVILGLIIGYLIKKYPVIKGSGVSQIKGNFMNKLDLLPWPELPLKFLGGIINIGAGLSVGREGPSVQMGAYVGSAVERIGKRSHLERLCLITSGAAAGLAAAFGAPFAGIIFAVEDLHQYLSPLLLTCVMIGAFAGDFVASYFFHPGAEFNFKNIRLFPLNYFGYLIILGVITAIIGHIFKNSIYKSQSLYSKLNIPLRLRPVIPFIVSVPVCIFLPLAASGGDYLIEVLAEKTFSVKMLLIILTVKIIFTGISAGSGAIGGIFVPLLACGALTGVLFSRILIFCNLIEQSYTINIMIFAMAGFFTTVIKAPLTAIILLLEISGNLFHLGGLVVTVLSSYMTANFMRSPANDEVLLKQILNDKDISDTKDSASDSRKELFEISINPESYLDGRLISEVIWPVNFLIVSIARGEEEIIPDGRTKLAAGDRLIILTESKHIKEYVSEINALANIEAE